MGNRPLRIVQRIAPGSPLSARLIQSVGCDAGIAILDRLTPPLTGPLAPKFVIHWSVERYRIRAGHHAQTAP